jgi:hypothetical protein
VQGENHRTLGRAASPDLHVGHRSHPPEPLVAGRFGSTPVEFMNPDRQFVKWVR